MGCINSSFEEDSEDDTTREIMKIRNKIVRANKNVKDLKSKLKDDGEVIAMGKAIMKSIIQPCPICFEPMIEEIKLCLKGHSTCGTCVSHYASCSLCREPISEYRNTPMESITLNILSKFDYREEKDIVSCVNEKYGCPINYPKSMTDFHEKSCKYTSIPSCCGVLLNYVNYLAHIRSKHPENIIMNGEIITSASNKLFLSVYDQTFVLYRRKNELNYYYNVFHLTLEPKRNCFAFRLIIKNKEHLVDEGFCTPCGMEDFMDDSVASHETNKFAEISIEEFHKNFQLEDDSVYETRLVIYSREP